jgi:putative ABC transport system ATP-binding protein
LEKINLNNPRERDFIRFDNVWKIYKNAEVEYVVLQDITLSIDEGEFLTVIGPSGSGKTTLLNLIGCLDTPTKGQIFYQNEEISGKDNDYLTDFRRNHVGFVFQFYNLIATLTAVENIEIILELMNLRSAEIKYRARFWLNMVGLNGKEDKFPFQLSGGEQQRVAFARALCKGPKIVLADEPTGNLDRRNEELLVDLMVRLNHETKTTLVVATHNERVTAHAHRVIEIEDGCIRERKSF